MVIGKVLVTTPNLMKSVILAPPGSSATVRARCHKHFGIWQVYSWKDYYLQVKFLALGLPALGLEPGDKVVIVGDNAPEWYYAEMAAQANHRISAGGVRIYLLGR